MPINKNHEFEELQGIKCAIVEKEVLPARVEFLKDILIFNGYTVVVIPTPPPKVAAKPAVPAQAGDTLVMDQPQPEPEQPIPPATFTLGVTDVAFNPTNAIFGRLLKTRDGKVVTLAYWQQKDEISRDEIPYFDGNL
jgi:hypothetical protein